MGIRYINAEPNAKFTRPTGFVFPVGLTSGASSSLVSSHLLGLVIDTEKDLKKDLQNPLH